jgi:hypothetical protein
VVYGAGSGTTRTVCTDPNCSVHHSGRVVPIGPEAEQRRREHERQQERRKRLMKRRSETFDRILEDAASAFTAPQLRVLLRAFITIDAYGYTDDVATHYVGNDENNQQSAEEILLCVADRLEDDELPRSLSVSLSPRTPAFPRRTLSTIWQRSKRSSHLNSQRRLRPKNGTEEGREETNCS